MLNFLLNLLGRYGWVTLCFAVICYLLYKIMTNHLKHIADDIKSILLKLNLYEERLSSTVERVARCEGKLDID